MYRTIGIASAMCALFVFVGCSGDDDDGQVQPDRDAGVRDAGPQNPPRDAGPVRDAGPPRDAGPRDGGPPPPPPPQDVVVSGQLTKLGAYLAGNNEYAENASIVAYGAANVTPVTTGPNGAYTITVPANGTVALAAQRQGYNQTYNVIATQAAPIMNKRIYIAEGAWLGEIAGAHNVNLNAPFTCQTPGLEQEMCIYGAVVGRILDDGTAGNGEVRPVGGVYPDDFYIYGPNDVEWYVRGPYFLDYTGTSSAAATQSVVYQNGQGEYLGGLYVFFPEIPQRGGGGQQIGLRVSITYDYNGNNRYFGPHDVSAFRAPGGAVTWANVYETGLAPPDQPIVDVDFDTEIYPMFAPVAEGGLGCVGCHTNQGGAVPSGNFNVYGGPEVAYAQLDPAQYPQRVNLASPSDSYLLVRPLYEADGNQDHPIYAFASEADIGYQTIYKWIQEGAVRNAPPPPVSFYNDIRPLLYQPSNNGGAGCYTCHVNGVDANTAPGGFYMGGDGNALYDELVNEAPNDPGPYNEAYRINKGGQYTGRSLVLTNPLFGNDEPHPVKIFFDNTDPRYQLIYRWVEEGYQNDTP